MVPKERIAEKLRAELLTGEEEWYYISLVHTPTNIFKGGVLVPGRGPTDAWVRFHSLNLYIRDCETATTGPLDADKMTKVTPELRCKLLSKEQLEVLGR